ncbi:MAG: hypothetical protein IKL65_02030 [Bacilli bacterium]|nr:hypothetical protein [Bacilli bacterium]
MKNEYYKLIGILNLYESNMDIVHPVFSNNGLFYFQNIKNDKIESFKLISNINLIKKIKIFEKGVNNSIINKNCCIGDRAFYAFQTDESDVFVSTLPGYLKFLKNLKTEFYSLNLEIKQFIKDNEHKKIRTIN